MAKDKKEITSVELNGKTVTVHAGPVGVYRTAGSVAFDIFNYLVIGLVAQLSTLWFPSQLMNAWALGLMIIMLLVRPQGILGRRERVG